MENIQPVDLAAVLPHLGRAEGEHPGGEMRFTQRRVGQLAVVAADVVKDAPVHGLHQVRQNWRLDRRAPRAPVQ